MSACHAGKRMGLINAGKARRLLLPRSVSSRVCGAADCLLSHTASDPTLHFPSFIILYLLSSLPCTSDATPAAAAAPHPFLFLLRALKSLTYSATLVSPGRGTTDGSSGTPGMRGNSKYENSSLPFVKSAGVGI